MLDVERVVETIRELYSLLETADRKADILTSVLKEANADYEIALNELQQARDELEERVKERTSALEAANEELRREVADRRRTEQALRQSEERYRTLVESSFDGIFVQKDHKVAFANSRLSEMLGYQAGELEGRDSLSIYHPDDRPLIVRRADARLSGEPVPSDYEIRMQRKDGSTFQVELAAKVVQFGGGQGVQVCVRDITERKRLEESATASTTAGGHRPAGRWSCP